MNATELADRQALRDLACRYARAIDDRHYALVGEVFCEDGELLGPGFHVKGLASIRAGMKAIERYSATMHSVYNQLFEISGDQAEGETYCVAHHLHEVDGHPVKLDWGIRYQDRCRREADGWRFERRELRVVWKQELPLKESKR